MPQKNSRKEYGAGGYYHIYNRGVEKRNIFLDDQDYKVFLGYMKIYLEEPEKPGLQGQALQTAVPPSKVLKNYHDQIELLAYCLMPNHFHLLIKQSTDRGIAEFMQSIALKYVLYFNRKYKRVGSLFQGRYKTVSIESEEQFVFISKYIHRNPIGILSAMPARPGLADLADYMYSSYGNYLGMFRQNWVKVEEILTYFSRTHLGSTYRSFVEEKGDISRVYYEMIDMDD